MSESKLSVYGDWLVQEADGCTCQGSDAHYGHQPGCGYEPLVKLDEIKAALKAARIAVIELPDPVRTPPHGQMWSAPYFPVWNLIGAGDIGVMVGGIGPRTAADARSLAAALLAAADAAESVQP